MSERVRLVLLSFLMLFLELGLIRWLGSNVFYLSYFSNFILLGSFLGIGTGFLIARRRDVFGAATPMLAILIGLVALFPIAIDRSGSELVYFGFATHGLPIWVALPVLFLATAAIMTAVAQAVARAFSSFAPLEGYRLDILGSIAGIVTFSLLSFAGAPPVVWGSIVVALLLALGSRPRPSVVVAALAVVFMLGRESADPASLWSPYYKLSLGSWGPGQTGLYANGIPHQTVEAMEVRRRTEPLYFVPYRRIRHNSLGDVLIIGAGTGGDVAIALAAGAKHIDAVEIDPRIYALGRRINPDRPYDSPKVSVHIDDGRAYLERTKSRYDLILLALPDSLALVSGQSSLRLESYLFTLDAMRAARARLADDGAFGMYNYYREPWLVDRFAATLTQAFGSPPCVAQIQHSGTFALLIVGARPGAVACDSTWHAVAIPRVVPVSDDRPFPYLREPSIPAFYLVTLALIVAVSALAVRVVAGPFASMGGYLDLFFMGAAFLLLETKNVVQFALLFGTTWFVNALVFVGVLISVYAAVVVTERVRLPGRAVLYATLFASLALAWAIDPARLLALDVIPRFVVAVILAFAPIFIANLVFAERFRRVAASTTAFGANLLGAMLGGVLEYAALIVGYRALLIVVALLYACAFVMLRRGGDADVAPA